MSTITNATFLISPLIGHLIDRLGFRPVGLLLVLCMPAVILCLWWEGPIAQWLALVLICLLNALAFTVQFAYLTITFSSAYYPGLLTITLAVQGTLGFIAWPLLVEVAPFGHDPCLGNFLLMAAPTPLLLAWPLGRGSVNGKGAGAPHRDAPARSSTRCVPLSEGWAPVPSLRTYRRFLFRPVTLNHLVSPSAA